ALFPYTTLCRSYRLSGEVVGGRDVYPQTGFGQQVHVESRSAQPIGDLRRRSAFVPGEFWVRVHVAAEVDQLSFQRPHAGTNLFEQFFRQVRYTPLASRRGGRGLACRGR